MKDVHDLEVYSPIEGFPDYLITSQGRVLSLKGNKMRELKQGKLKRGYMNVVLCKNGKGYNKRVHQLVAQAFIPNPENKTEVNHIDENKINNHVSNLEWLSHKENINHGTHNQRSSKTRSKKVIAKSLTETKILIFKSTSQGEKFGFLHSAISSCCNGKSKYYKGYTWQFIDKDKNK